MDKDWTGMGWDRKEEDNSIQLHCGNEKRSR